jgi:hypothetical protein
MAPDTEHLALVDIAVLLNHERATTDQCFVNDKLQEVVFPSEALRSIQFNTRELLKGQNSNQRTWMVLDEVKANAGRRVPANIEDGTQLPTSHTRRPTARDHHPPHTSLRLLREDDSPPQDLLRPLPT